MSKSARASEQRSERIREGGREGGREKERERERRREREREREAGCSRAGLCGEGSFSSTYFCGLRYCRHTDTN